MVLYKDGVALFKKLVEDRSEGNSPSYNRYPVLISIDFEDFSCPFTLTSVLVLIKNIYQTLEAVVHDLSKHLESHQKNTPLHIIFSTLFSVFEFSR